MHALRIFAVCAATFVGFGFPVVDAAPTCTGWYQQPDGSVWRECTDDHGNVYCEQCWGKGACERVPCR